MIERFVRKQGIEAAPMNGETVLFNPANNKFCVLNATAAFIWQKLDRPQTAREISIALGEQFAGVDGKSVEEHVINALLRLQEIECVIGSESTEPREVR